MSNTIKSVCEELQSQLCKKQDFQLAVAVRDVKLAHGRKSKGGRTVAVKNLLKLLINH